MVVRVSPAALGRRHLPVVWMENGKAVRRSVLRPGYTTIVERFPGGARVTPKVGRAGWKVSRLNESSWNSQFAALPQGARG
jgi:hypothetical protein